eukprot:4323109-Prymnesium_polylepis.1
MAARRARSARRPRGPTKGTARLCCTTGTAGRTPRRLIPDVAEFSPDRKRWISRCPPKRVRALVVVNPVAAEDGDRGATLWLYGLYSWGGEKGPQGSGTKT